MAVVDILLDLAPEFTALYGSDPARVLRVIGYAAEDISTNVWGIKADRANALLAAHMLTVANLGGTGSGGGGGGPVPVGPVISVREREVERRYGGGSAGSAGIRATSGGNLGYEATAYGREFIQLLRTVYTRPVVLD